MKKVIRFIKGFNGWIGGDTSEWEAPFPAPSGNASGVEVYNIGPDPIWFHIDPASLTPLRVIDPGTSDQILWAAPTVIYAKGNAEITIQEIEV